MSDPRGALEDAYQDALDLARYLRQTLEARPVCVRAQWALDQLEHCPTRLVGAGAAVSVPGLDDSSALVLVLDVETHGRVLDVLRELAGEAAE